MISAIALSSRQGETDRQKLPEKSREKKEMEMEGRDDGSGAINQINWPIRSNQGQKSLSFFCPPRFFCRWSAIFGTSLGPAVCSLAERHKSGHSQNGVREKMRK
jgi:hypothetical protein